MFQYFYLISLLLCIKTIFSYEYLDDVPGRHFHSFGNNVRKVNTSGKRKDRRHSIRHDYGYDRNPVEFDVAGFIRSDEESVADDGAARHRNYRRRRISKNNNDFNSLLGLNTDEGNSRDVNQDYLGRGDSSAKLSPSLMDLAPPILKDSLNIKHLKMNAAEAANAKYGNENYKNLYKNQIVLPEQSLTHNPQKKCILKDIKFPFFSHCNKTESLKPKKTRKRKLFCFNNPKKNSKGKGSQNLIQATSTSEEKKNKRSFEDNKCGPCKNNFVAFKPKDKRKEPWNKKLHNRLIADKFIETKATDSSKDASKKLSMLDDEHFIDNTEEIKRNKREEAGILMRRELDVIQQMIEHDYRHVYVPDVSKSSNTP